jgi:gliding motility-associated lipoprotein GldH
MVKKDSLLFLLLISILISFASCSSDKVYNKAYDIKGSRWDKENVLNFNFTINDTVNPCDVLFNVRHSSKYKYQNLYLFINTTSPTGNSVRDTFEVMLADDKGRWYGNGWGDIYEVLMPYKRYVRFPDTGTYTMEVQHAMRTDQLKNITDFGLQIEKAKTPEK